jgi:hypothetical protein
VIVAIGSWALRSITGCKVADLDLVASPDEREGLIGRSSRVVSDSPKKSILVHGGPGVEVEWALPGTSSELLIGCASGEGKRVPGVGLVRPVSPEALCAVYASTCLFPAQWEKNLARYRVLRSIGFSPDPAVMALRTQEIAARFGYDGRRYDRPNKDFFRDSVDRGGVSHDALHLELMFGDRPAYESLKRDLSRSGICLDLFEALSYEDRLRCVWEEALVLGEERFRRRGHADRRAAALALRGLCTNWYPLEFRPFLVEAMADLEARFPFQMWKDMDARRSARPGRTE